MEETRLVDTITDLPPELLFKILAYITLPRNYQLKKLSQLGYLTPSEALRRATKNLERVFGIPQELSFNNHFVLNQQWVHLQVVPSPKEHRRRLGGKNIVMEGTFEPESMFYDNVKHLAFTSSLVRYEDHAARIIEAHEMRYIIMDCKALVTITLYQDTIGEKVAAYYRKRLRAAIKEKYLALDGSAQKEDDADGEAAGGVMKEGAGLREGQGQIQFKTFGIPISD